MRERLLDEMAAAVDPEIKPLVQNARHAAQVVRAERNECFYLQGAAADGLYVVCHGAVLLEWDRTNGSVVGFRLALAGDNFGARSYCASEPHAANARALRETLVVHLASATLDTMLTAQPILWRALACTVARDSGPRLAKIIRNARIPVTARLAYLLYYLDDLLLRRSVTPLGHPDSPLRQRHMAHLLDVNEETISRSLNTLKKQKLIAVDPDSEAITIPDHDALAALFGSYI